MVVKKGRGYSAIISHAVAVFIVYNGGCLFRLVLAESLKFSSSQFILNNYNGYTFGRLK